VNLLQNHVNVSHLKNASTLPCYYTSRVLLITFSRIKTKKDAHRMGHIGDGF